MARGIRIGALMGIVGGLMATYHATKKHSGYEGKAFELVRAVSGYWIPDGTWDWKKMSFTLPAAAGCGASMVASKVGLNRYTPKGINI